MMRYPTAWLQGAALGEKIACELRLQIISGSITPNTILSENQIASEFGTSRNPVREALRTLSGEGLIRLERMGVVILGMTQKDVEELYDIRLLIETFILERLSQMPCEPLLLTLKQTIDKMEMAAKHNNYEDFSYQDLYFHETMIVEANHTRMLHLWNNIRYIVLTSLLVATKRRFDTESHEIQPLIDKHKLIVSALVSKDLAHIKQVVHDHFKDTLQSVSKNVVKP